MTDKILKLLKKHKELIVYIVFGALTTAVSQISFMILLWLLPGASSVPPTVISWVIAVLFAYATNRRWVFASKARGVSAVSRELASFFGARAFSLLIAVAVMRTGADIMGYDPILTRLAANALEIVLNYIFSKFLIFKHT